MGPALIAVAVYGDNGSNQLLVASQVVLSMQLPLAIVPLLLFAQDRGLMGRWRVKGMLLWISWALAGAIGLANVTILWQTFGPTN